MKIVNRVLRLGFLLSVMPFLFSVCSSISEKRIRVIKQAFNTKDIANTISRCYSDNVIYEVDGLKGKGRHMLRGAAEWDSVTNTRLSFSDFKASGDTVFCKCTEENEISKLQGLDRIYFDPVYFVFQGKKISEMNFRSTAESHKAQVLSSAPFLHWFYNERNDSLPSLLTNGKLVQNTSTALKYLSLVQEWHDTPGKTVVR